jgi:AmmeMemoRadiSam system protein B
MHSVRQPAVAGAFYSGNKGVLANDIKAFLDSTTPVKGQASPKAIVVPHAGYIYSGQTAAIAYSHLVAGCKTIKRVILLGPVHRVSVRGLALPGADAFATPLGEIELDQAAIASISHLHQIVVSPTAHAQEHSLEVQLPFLQSVLDEFKLVPLAVGDTTPAEIAEILDILWGGSETLIVISSDLSHFLPYDIAQKVDSETVQNILDMKVSLTHNQACGGAPINGLVLAARRHHLKPKLLDLCNSGDTAGDKNRVVGYASFMFNEESSNV